MTDKRVNIGFDFQGAMRQLGRMTRKGVDTVKEKTGMPADEAAEDDTAPTKDSSKTREGGE